MNSPNEFGVYMVKHAEACSKEWDEKAYPGGYGDEYSSHWLEIVPSVLHEDGASIEMGVSADSQMPGRLEIFAPITPNPRCCGILRRGRLLGQAEAGLVISVRAI